MRGEDGITEIIIERVKLELIFESTKGMALKSRDLPRKQRSLTLRSCSEVYFQWEMFKI